MRYFANLTTGRIVLWCYFIWYAYFTARYFDRSPNLWLTSVGISAIVGVALLLSTWHEQARFLSWTTFRLFLMPFCVSSFSALVKGKEFILVFSPRVVDDVIALVGCLVFCGFVLNAKMAKRNREKTSNQPGTPEVVGDGEGGGMATGESPAPKE